MDFLTYTLLQNLIFVRKFIFSILNNIFGAKINFFGKRKMEINFKFEKKQTDFQIFLNVEIIYFEFSR